MKDFGPLRLEWRRTWNHVERDFTCFSPDADMSGEVGRIHLTLGPHGAEHWFWTCYGTIGWSRLLHNASGHANTKMDAARSLEERWFAWVEQALKESRVRCTTATEISGPSWRIGSSCRMKSLGACFSGPILSLIATLSRRLAPAAQR